MSPKTRIDDDFHPPRGWRKTLWINLLKSALGPLKTTTYFIRHHICDFWGHPPMVFDWRKNWRMLADDVHGVNKT